MVGYSTALTASSHTAKQSLISTHDLWVQSSGSEIEEGLVVGAATGRQGRAMRGTREGAILAPAAERQCTRRHAGGTEAVEGPVGKDRETK
jgi:hypothetical protein